MIERVNRWTGRRKLLLAGALLLRRGREPDTPSSRQSETRIEANTELPVLGYAALVELTDTARLIERLRIKLGFPREVFEHAVRPVIEGYAQYVQLLPAPETPDHTHPDALFTRALEVAGRALDFRRGQILPRGAAPEVIGREAHRWTYAVFVAALLHDVGWNIAALRVLVCPDQGTPERWSPAAGSMSACAAVSYRVESLDRAARQPQLLAGLPVEMLERFVPQSVWAWLNQDPDLMRELLAFLSGEVSACNGAISELVRRARSERVSRSLTSLRGTRPTLREVLPAVAPAVGNIEGGVTSLGSTPDQTTIAQRGLADQEREHLEDVGKCAQCPASGEHDFNHSGAAGPAVDSMPGPLHTTGIPDPPLARASEPARRFLAWLQQGLAEGRLGINKAGGLVHFVPEGMLLVSPRIFREFARRLPPESIRFPLPVVTGEPDIGKWVQRQVLRAGWHLQADKGVNIHTYQVMRGGRPVSTLHGVVILDPARFIKSVPHVNPVLVRRLSSTAEV